MSNKCQLEGRLVSNKCLICSNKIVGDQDSLVSSVLSPLSASVVGIEDVSTDLYSFCRRGKLRALC